MAFSCGAACVLRPLLLALILKLAMGYPVATIDPLSKSATTNIIRCSLKDIRCINKGKLPFSDGRCFDPLERGPCSVGEWFTLDTNSSSWEYRAVQCSPRPCAPGHVFLEGSCLDDAEARIRLCDGDPIHLDPAGSARCGEQPVWREVLAAQVMCSRRVARREMPYTEIAIIPSSLQPITETVVRVDGVPCAVTNEGKCASRVDIVTPATVFELDHK